MSEEFRIMGFRELEKFYEENGYYADQDPRNAMNFFDTDTLYELYLKSKREQIISRPG